MGLEPTTSTLPVRRADPLRHATQIDIPTMYCFVLPIVSIKYVYESNISDVFGFTKNAQVRCIVYSYLMVLALICLIVQNKNG